MTAKIVDTYDYLDETGTLLFQVVRYAAKIFKQRRPDGNSGWIWNLNGTRRVLYKLPELLQSSRQDWFFICEGEKDCNKLIAEGLPATTCPMGAGAWRDDYNPFFENRLVAIVPDADEAGQKHKEQVAKSLYGTAAEIRIIDLPGLKLPLKDVFDWLGIDGNSVTKLMELVDKTEPYEPPDDSPAKSTAARFNLSDVGNAERLAAKYGNRLRYCWGWDKWLFYDDRRWSGETGNERAQQLAVKTVRSIIPEAQKQPDEIRTALVKWSLASESTHRINAMLTAARAIEGLSTYPKDFDTDTMKFNCLNGTIDLRTGELRPHNPDDMITMLSPVEYDPDAQLDLWDEVLDTAAGGDKELQNFSQKAVGYSLTGDTGEEKLFFVHGPAATSKTTVIEGIKSTLGDYATTADFESFLRRPPQGGILRNDIASLAGRRFVTSVEVDEGRRLAEGLIKVLSGGDKVRARFLYKESFEFVPQFKLWLAANHEPKISDDDDAIWRRIVKIPFTHEIPKEKRDPKVKATLRNPEIAGAAILAWAVKGCLRWQHEGLKIPTAVEEATEKYRLEQDPLKDFYEELQFDPTAYVPVKEMRAAYEAYVKDNGIRCPLSASRFNERIEAHGGERKPRRVPNDVGTKKLTKIWTGVTLASNPKKLELEMIEDEIPF